MRIQQFRKVFGGTRSASGTRSGAPGWMRGFASGITASNLVRHGVDVPSAHGARVRHGRHESGRPGPA